MKLILFHSISLKVSLLQNNIDALRQEFEEIFEIDTRLRDNLMSCGFEKQRVEEELRKNRNHLQNTLDKLLGATEGTAAQIAAYMREITNNIPGPSTSQENRISTETEVCIIFFSSQIGFLPKISKSI